jgi:hypothetical protein
VLPDDEIVDNLRAIGAEEGHEYGPHIEVQGLSKTLSDDATPDASLPQFSY